MSIQFRSRISGQYNPPTILGDSASGWCCGLNSTSTRAACDKVNGYFIPGGFNDNDCPVSSSCSQGLVAVNAGACCYWTKNNGVYSQTCGDVTSQLECINLNEGASEGLGYSFYAGNSCITNGGNIVCNAVDIAAKDVTTDCNPNDSTNCFILDNLIGNCCTLTQNGNTECTLSSRLNCFGYWSPPVNGVQSCADKTPCSGVYFSGLSGGETPARASLTTLNISTNPIETLPSIGSFYQGGLYVGIFTPGTPINTIGSTVYGNQTTGVAATYKARGSGVGTKEKSWILIAAIADYTDAAYNAENEPSRLVNTSNYDGLYNTYNSTISQENVLLDEIKKYKLNGFSDWYLPSQDELAFYFNTFSFSYEVPGFAPLLKQQYMSSTVFKLNGTQEFDGKTFIVAQMADTADNYGKTNAVYRKNTIGIRLFRRIYLDT